MIKRIAEKDKITKIALAVFVLQFLYIVFLNLFKCRAWIDHDASMLYSHTIHMWEQGKFVLPFYQEETFLHIDTSCLLAMPLYGLTKDIFLSYGIANVIFLALTLFVMNDILAKVDVREGYRYIAMALYLIPYRVGLVDYTNMVFYECSFYNVCILVAILGIDLFLYAEDASAEKGDRKYITLLILYAFFSALTAFSRGTYTLLVAVLPIVFCYVLEVILSEDGMKHIRRSKLVLIAVTFLSFFAGMGLGKITGFKPEVTGYSLVLPGEMIENFFAVFWGHLSIFVGHDNPSVMTPEGITMLILLGYAFLMIVVIIFNLKHAFGENQYATFLRYLTIVYLWNVCILGLTNCFTGTWAYPERYLFPGFVPLLLSVPVMFTYMEKVQRILLRQSLGLVVYGLAALTLIICDAGVIKSFRQNADELLGIRQTIAYARDNGMDTVFFLNDDNAGLLSRCLDKDLRVVSVQTHEEDGTYNLRARENYMCAHDKAYYSDENILAVKWNDQPEAVLKDYQLSSYQYVGDVEDYHLYHAGSNKFDDRAGFPLNDNVMDHSTDLCHTAGYQTIGQIDLYGYLESVGEDNYVLLSPQLDPPYKACDVTLRYETGLKTAGDGSSDEESSEPETEDNKSRNIGMFRLLDANMNTICETAIDSSPDEAVLTADTDKPCYLAVWLNSGEKITLCEIDYQIQ